MTDTRTYPGSLDNGATDAEYSPVARIICGSDDTYATNENVMNLRLTIDNLTQTIENLAEIVTGNTARIVGLEAHVHRILNTPEGQSPFATEPPRPRAVIYADAVPWEALREVMRGASANSEHWMISEKWLLSSAPKEAAE